MIRAWHIPGYLGNASLEEAERFRAIADEKILGLLIRVEHNQSYFNVVGSVFFHWRLL